jgi:hypothetical protein
MRFGRFVLFVFLLAAIGAAAAWHSGWRPPDRLNPLAPIRVAEEPGPFLGWKLRRLEGDRALCEAALAGSAMRYRTVQDRRTADDCGYENAVHVAGSDLSYGSGFVATCPLAVGLALWENHVLQPAAREAFGAEVRGIDHYGTYACRNVNNRQTGRRSQHAFANAIDIAGFRLADGRHVTVLRDLDDAGSDPASTFLNEVHDGACGIFGSVLGPNYNAAHRNHFHFDMGAFFGLCR